MFDPRRSRSTYRIRGADDFPDVEDFPGAEESPGTENLSKPHDAFSRAAAFDDYGEEPRRFGSGQLPGRRRSRVSGRFVVAGAAFAAMAISAFLAHELRSHLGRHGAGSLITSVPPSARREPAGASPPVPSKARHWASHLSGEQRAANAWEPIARRARSTHSRAARAAAWSRGDAGAPSMAVSSQRARALVVAAPVRTGRESVSVGERDQETSEFGFER